MNRALDRGYREVDRLSLWISSGSAAAEVRPRAALAIGETVILLHPPLPLVGVSIDMARECQQFDSLADG